MEGLMPPTPLQRQMARKWLAATEDERALTSERQQIAHLKAALACVQYDAAMLEQDKLGTNELMRLWGRPSKHAKENARTQPVAATIDAFARAVAEELTVPVESLYSADRRPAVCAARYAAWALAYAMSSLPVSLSDLGAAFNRHHTTILHGIDQVLTNKTARQVALRVAHRLQRQDQFRQWLKDHAARDRGAA